MARPSTAEVEAATRLLRLARRLTPAAEAHTESAVAARLLGALFEALGPVIGVAGVSATFARSVKLSKAEYPCLEAMATTGSEPPRSDPDVSDRLADCLRHLDPTSALEAATELYATFFRLLSSFIGEQLFWQIVKGRFPDSVEIELEERE